VNQDERDPGVPTSRVLERVRLGGRGSAIHQDESHRAPLGIVGRMAECLRQCARADRIVTRLIELGAQ
jgi:hypothetical protein